MSVLKRYNGSSWEMIGGTSTLPATQLTGSTADLNTALTGNDLIINPMTTAGDIIYGGTSGAPTRLAAGTAGQVLLSGGAGAPVWSGLSKIITFTRDLSSVSGDVAYTGIGFKPSVIIFVYWISSGVVFGIAVYGSSTLYGVVTTQTGWVVYSTDRIDVYPTGGGRQDGIVKSLDSDGFTLTWTKTSSPTGTVTCRVICFK